MRRQKLLIGTCILASANFITKFMGFFYRIFMSKFIGSEGMGLYQLILPLYTLSWSITAAGFTTTISRLTAAEHIKGETGTIGRIVKQSIMMCCGISILFSILLFFFSDEISIHILQEPRTALSLRLLAFAIPFMAVGSCLRGFFMGLQHMSIPAISQVLEQTLRIGAIFLLSGFFVPKGLEYACLAAVCGIVLGEFGSFLYTLFGYFYFKRRHKFIKRPSLSSAACTAMILAMVIPLATTRIMDSLLGAVENILIPHKLEDFGYTATQALSAYGELTGMVMPLLMLPSAVLLAFSVSLVPEISEACAVSQHSRIQRTVSVTLLFTSILGIGSACVFAVFPMEICYIVYNQSNLGKLLFPLAFLCPFIYGQTTLSGLLNGFGEQFFLFWSHILSSLLGIAFVWFGVPYYGLTAYYAGWFFSLVVVTILSLQKLKQRTGVSFSFFDCFAKPLLAGSAAALLTRYAIQVSESSKLLFLLSFMGMGILYLFFLYLLGCFSKENIQTLLGKSK